jgi:CRP/FNR family cyclic AMP-dependent transcriptional regulator
MNDKTEKRPAVEVHTLIGALRETATPRAVEEGVAIFREGDRADAMFIVRRGSVRIEREGEVLRHLAAGEVFGEMALVDAAPRSADAIAGADCELAVVDEAAFQELVVHLPAFALELLRTVVRRLREETTRKP